MKYDANLDNFSELCASRGGKELVGVHALLFNHVAFRFLLFNRTGGSPVKCLLSQCLFNTNAGRLSINLLVCCKYANNWDELLSVWLLASYAIFKSQTKSKSKVLGAKTPFVVQKCPSI